MGEEPAATGISPMATDDGLSAFVERLAARNGVLAVILFGSRARGNARPDSDFDLLVIQREGHARVVEHVGSRVFEIVHETEQGARESWDANPADAVAFWQVARVLHDRDGTGARLRRLGDRILATKPPPPSTERTAHARFDAMDSLRAAAALLDTFYGLRSPKEGVEVARLILEQVFAWHPAPGPTTR